MSAWKTAVDPKKLNAMHRWRFDPQEDITAYELAKCLKVMSGAGKKTAIDIKAQAIEMGVAHHFTFAMSVGSTTVRA